VAARRPDLHVNDPVNRLFGQAALSGFRLGDGVPDGRRVPEGSYAARITVRKAPPAAFSDSRCACVCRCSS
jgi:hypothetical protein